jgi:hypothetical protein
MEGPNVSDIEVPPETPGDETPTEDAPEAADGVCEESADEEAPADAVPRPRL